MSSVTLRVASTRRKFPLPSSRQPLLAPTTCTISKQPTPKRRKMKNCTESDTHWLKSNIYLGQGLFSVVPHTASHVLALGQHCPQQQFVIRLSKVRLRISLSRHSLYKFTLIYIHVLNVEEGRSPPPVYDTQSGIYTFVRWTVMGLQRHFRGRNSTSQSHKWSLRRQISVWRFLIHLILNNIFRKHNMRSSLLIC